MPSTHHPHPHSQQPELEPQSPSFDIPTLNARHPLPNHHGSSSSSFDSPIALQSLQSLRGPGASGLGADDLSLSELSLDDLGGSGTRGGGAPPFDLARASVASKANTKANANRKDGIDPQEGTIRSSQDEVDPGLPQGQEDGPQQAIETPTTPSKSQSRAQSREERLQSDLLILRTLNGAIIGYVDALRNAKELSERVGARMEESNHILDRYVDVLWESERTSQLIFDKGWQGGEVDDAIIDERIQKENDERERAIREEEERKERVREEKEKQREAAERSRKEAERTQGAGNPGVKGVRGVRGVRGVSTRARGAGSVPGRGAGAGIGRGTPGTRGTTSTKRVSPSLTRGRVP